jgi:cell division septum initiation protein DivIVA
MANGDGLDPEVGLAPEEVERADFGTVRRGYEPEPVRRRLREAATEIRRLSALADSLQQRLGELEAAPPEKIETAHVVEALGDEAARVLQAARDAARERLERAESQRQEMTAEARAAAAAIVEESRDHGRELVAEARAVRERILSDLAFKRHGHRVEVEQLRVIRDRLLEAVSVCRDGLDGWIADFIQAGPQAEAAAARAGLLIAAEPEATVGEMEAEIRAARAAKSPPDEETAEGPPDDEHEAYPAAAAAAAAPESPEEPEVAARPAEPAVVEELDELEEEAQPEPDVASGFGRSDYVEIVGYRDKPPEPSARVTGLYDVEAEPRFESGTEPDAVDEYDQDVVVHPVASTDETSRVAGADAIFARLRSITSRPVTEPARDADTGGGSVSDEPSDEAPDEAPGPDDLVGAARAVAVGGIARRLKRLVVDEQGELLDSLRRGGSRAVRNAISADASRYTRAAVEPLQDFASDIDVSIDDIDMKAATAAIVSVLIEPARARLSELVEETDDTDELGRAVRSIYRESRSRRAEAAAEAALSAGWPETVS